MARLRTTKSQQNQTSNFLHNFDTPTPQQKTSLTKHYEKIQLKSKKWYWKTLPQHSLVTIFKAFVRPNLDYGYIMYDQPNNKGFSQKEERIR